MLTSIFRKRRPRRSVWSVPHRLGTLTTHCLWTFMSQAGKEDTKKERHLKKKQKTVRVLLNWLGKVNFKHLWLR